MPVNGEDAVNAINGVFGSHRGCRAAHARGTVCRGHFTPTADAANLTSAAHMREGPVEVTVRFSNASGDPGFADGAPDARGMATKFHLPNGEASDIVAVTLPCFFVTNREDFLELNHALRRNARGSPSPLALPRLARFYIKHEEARTAIRSVLRPKPVPSYANCRFNALHSFKWTGPSGTSFVRYSWRPDAGERTISSRDAKSRSSDYLQEDLYDRLGREPIKPIRFTLQLQIASKADYERDLICDATAVWPGDRKKKERITPVEGGKECDRFIDAGILELTGLAGEASDANDVLVFDPMRLTEGIEAPIFENGNRVVRDEILHFRPEAYSVSVARRTAVVDGDHS
jgi:catalase